MCAGEWWNMQKHLGLFWPLNAMVVLEEPDLSHCTGNRRESEGHKLSLLLVNGGNTKGLSLFIVLVKGRA